MASNIALVAFLAFQPPCPSPRPGLPMPTPQLRTHALGAPRVSGLKVQARRWLEAKQALDPGHTAPPIYGALLDHEATKGLPAFIDVPSYLTAPASPDVVQIPLVMGFLYAGKPPDTSLAHLPAVPSPFLALLVSMAPECLLTRQNPPGVPWRSSPPPIAWNNFACRGPCAIIAHCELGDIPVAHATSAGRLIHVAYALSRAKCGFTMHIPQSAKNSRDRRHPITSLSVENA